MRLPISGILWLALVCGPTAPSSAQSLSESNQSKDQFFAGLITAISATQITVSRTILGKQPSTRTFQITAETRIEGKPEVKARVTVEFVGSVDGDRAVHIIVRGAGTEKDDNKKK